MNARTTVGVSYFARCDCGWRGPNRETAKHADGDGWTHDLNCPDKQEAAPDGEAPPPTPEKVT